MEEDTPNTGGAGILDAVSHSQQSQTLRELNPQQVVFNLLNNLSEREKTVLISRHGLDNGKIETLERIGTKLSLTRERVRQIEKEALSKLRKQKLPFELSRTIELIHDLLKSAGEIMTEEKLIDTLLPAKTEALEMDILFIFQLSDDFTLIKESKKSHKSWHLSTADLREIGNVIEEARNILKESKQTISTSDLLHKVKERLQNQSFDNLTEEVFENYLSTTKRVDKNIFDEWGLSQWPEIRPKDVGDKASLILKKNREPLHYHKITELINKQKFDAKIAQKETVHNELIKDKRFILVGRGIYALKEWGYRKGTVGDIIENVLIHAGRPLNKQEIVKAVMEQRMVKRNTIIVGLSNKSRFKKTPENKYTVLDTER